MARILSGKEVAAAINARIKEDVEALAKRSIFPKLATLRVGEC